MKGLIEQNEQFQRIGENSGFHMSTYSHIMLKCGLKRIRDHN